MSAPRIISAVSTTALAASIGYFAYTLSQYKDVAPALVSQLTAYNTHMEKLNMELSYFNVYGSDFTRRIPSMQASFHEVAVSLDNAAITVDEMRQQTESFEQELKQLRDITPGALASLDAATAELNTLNGYIPESNETAQTLAMSINKAAGDVQRSTQRIEAFQPTMDALATEVRETRIAVPYYFAEVRSIINEANQVGEKTSEGIVGGFVKGIFTSPIKVLQSAGKSLKATFGGGLKLNEEEQRKISDTIQKALHSGEQSFWNDKETKNRGSVTPTDVYTRYGRECRSINIEVIFDVNGQTELTTLEMCRSSNPEIWIQISE